MKYLKILCAVACCSLLIGCDEHHTTTNHKKKPAPKPQVSRAFDALGDTKGENELNYEHLATGEVVFHDNAEASKFNGHYAATGYASWYGKGFHGKRTANGSKFDQHAYSAAHPHLPMPSVLRVVNLSNQRSVLVVVNDRGPNTHSQKNGRIIDVSKQAAKDLGLLASGVAKVKVEYLHDETLKLMRKYPKEMQAKANTHLEQSMKRYMADLNKPNNG